MTREWEITQEAFDRLLAWLDPDRERAGLRYERIRLRLIKIFTCRGCCEAEDLADETIQRVTRKLGEIIERYTGDQALYFYAVARKVHQEYLRKISALQQAPSSEGPSPGQNLKDPVLTDDIEALYACLEQCMEGLSAENRRLVLEYYQEEKQAKIDRRRKLAAQLGIAANALRIRAHRIRVQLQQCVQNCMEQAPAH